MYKAGEIVVYGRTGLCEITEIIDKAFSVASRLKTKCYVLKPLKDVSSTVFIPVDNEKLVSTIRYPLSKKEIDSLIKKASKLNFEWNEDRHHRLDFFKSVLSQGITENLIAMIRCLSGKKRELIQVGKKLCLSDEGVFNEAKQMIDEEFSFSLKIGEDEVENYVISRIG